MAVPKRRTSKSRKKKRRTHFKLDSPASSLCDNCGQVKQPHHACPHCGSYRGREVVAVEE